MASQFRVLDPFFFPQPLAILGRIGELISEGGIFFHLGITLLEAVLALIIGGALGIAAGFALARNRFAAAVLDPYIRAANALPRVVLAPLFLLWFGLGIWSKVAFGVSLVFFLVFFNTYRGVLDVRPVLVNNALLLGASEKQLIRHVLLPSALSWIFSSLQAAIGFALVGAVVGEYMGASKGLGYVIAQYEGVFDTVGVFAGVFLLAAAVLAISAAVEQVERRLLRWKQEERG
jgi:NitT/TauT family transport system permease protein